MPIHRSLPLVLIALLVTASVQAADPPKPAPPQSAESAQAQRRTVDDIRNVGTAMFSWLDDQVNNEAIDGSSDPEADSACLPAGAEIGHCESVNLDKVPLISLQELTKILVPKYIAAIPENDAWGHPYEYRFNWKHTLSKSVMAIRSPGSDKTFSGNSYTVGSFEPVDTDQDIVWMDAFFVRWPERGKS
ncbi:MAG TPA: hypothetical protein VH988_14850 [Thermoanaerobaculia bacterium]|jgi:hypothetical protein|nr:hypothetical protein [Thermoanaerobaculia bacterium]